MKDKASRDSQGNVEGKEHYQVGRGKPPPWRKWKPGQSGNPAGRPPGSISAEKALIRELKNNREKLQEIVAALIKRAANGDSKSWEIISKYLG